MTDVSTTRWPIPPEARRHFLEELRHARLSAQKDAEAFDELLFVFERLGCYLKGRAATLGKYKDDLLALAEKSVLGANLDGRLANWHTDKSVLYTLVNHARNDALHQGAGARHLTEHAIELALLFEDALMNGADDSMTELRDIMVRSPAVAEAWQPVSFVRQVMLTNSFSTLPIYHQDKWCVITDSQVAAFLRSVPNDRLKLLGTTIEDAAKACPALLGNPAFEKPNAPIADVAKRFASNPQDAFILVLDDPSTKPQSRALLGIVTAFDIL